MDYHEMAIFLLESCFLWLTLRTEFFFFDYIMQTQISVTVDSLNSMNRDKILKKYDYQGAGNQLPDSRYLWLPYRFWILLRFSEFI